MSRFRLSYTPDKRRQSPVSHYVHRALSSNKASRFRHAWDTDEPFDPPLPPRVVGKGYPFFHVETAEMEWLFASPEEITYVIGVLGQKCLPSVPQVILASPLQLPGGERAAKGDFVALHRCRTTWLTRLPAGVRGWKKRQRLVRTLEKALEYFHRHREA